MQSNVIQHNSQEDNRETPGIDELAGLLVDAFPRLGPENRTLALKLYEMLADGEAVSHIGLAEALDRPPGNVSRTLGQWPGVFYDEIGRIVGFWGLSVKEMRHRLRVNGKTSYAWCAWDTLFIPELLNATVEIVSACARSGAEIRLTISPASVQAVEPSDVVLSFLAPDERALREDVTASFCHFVHFFRSPEDGEAWVAEHDDTFLFSLDDAFVLGKKINAARYGAMPEFGL